MTFRRTSVVLAAVISALPLAVGVAPASALKKPVAPITVLVSNDDGVAAPGIDALVEGLRAVPKTKVVVVAPAENQTGAGGKFTEGPVHAAPAKTLSGYPATAVDGTPVDSVNYAFDTMKLHPTVTLSGTNKGQNLGGIVEVSGTVGAARVSGTHGVAALAVSAQIEAPDYPLATKVALEWLAAHRAGLVTAAKAAKAKKSVPLAEITNLNVPTCPDSKIHGTYDTVLAPPGTPDAVLATADCASTATTFPNDIAAFNAAWATETPVPVAPAG